MMVLPIRLQHNWRQWDLHEGLCRMRQLTGPGKFEEPANAGEVAREFKL